MEKTSIQEGVCPKCRTAYVVPIVYGKSTPEDVKGAQEGKGGWVPTSHPRG